MPSELDAKREANIAKKDAERKERNAQIAAQKQQSAAKRSVERSAKEKAEQAKQDAAAATATKRAENIAKREASRPAPSTRKPGSKYSKADVENLKKVFDTYDKDGSGKISLQEFKDELASNKKKRGTQAGVKSTLAERKAEEGTSIADLSDGVFEVMDKDGDGEIRFEEMLAMMYSLATPAEMATMIGWVAAAPEPEPEAEKDLSDGAKKEIRRMFKMYDADKSGALSVKELINAMKATMIDKEELMDMFKEYDVSSGDDGEIEGGDQMLSVDEFTALMKSTGAFDEE